MGETDEEDYVSFGSALDPLDEDNLPRKKPITIEEQVATDAQGRRRFHGAFTGGFSAGYFNSVGTRDGWRPQQFKSSRSSKANNVGQRPEDFMDEEDTGEFGIAPSGIRATNDFTDHSKGTKRQRSTTNNDGPIPGVPVLQDLLKPITDTVGVVLLKKMGWKPGQGVGPRVTKVQKQKTRKRNEKKKIYGCSLPNQEIESTKSCTESSEDDNDDGEEILFAPDDYEPFRSNPKDNFFGIGYSGLDRRSILGHVNLFGDTTFKMQDKNKKLSIRGQAFGVGAFEADDEDIYAREDMSNYDFSLGPAEAKKKLQKSVNSSAGIKCLEGFVSAKNSLVIKKLFKPPELPRDYKPIHAIKQSRFSPQEVPENVDDNHKRKGLGRHDLNAETRSAILGESSGSSPAVNIITKTLNLYGKEKTEERAKQELAKLKSSTSWMDKLKTTRFVRGGTEGNNDEENKNSIQMTKPFSDESKQKRFEKFKEFNVEERKEKLEKLQPLSMKDWERNQELQDFELALKLCCTNNIDSGPVNNDNKLLNSEVVIDDVPKDPMIEAAKSKMFGKLTRSVESWQPTSIVCKRFNIPEPMTGCAPQDVKTTKKYSVFDSLNFITDDKFKKASDTAGSYELPHIPYKSSNKNTNNSMNILDTTDIVASTSNENEKVNTFEKSYEKVFGSSTNDNENSNNSSAVYETATSSSSVSLKDKNNEKKDLFKAIFLSSSDEDSDKNDNDDDDVTSDAIKNVLIGKPANIVNIERNNSPPRGIFAKLDLDSLVKPNTNLVMITKDTGDSNDQLNLQNNEKNTTDMYGPVLPKKIPEMINLNTEKEDKNKEKYKYLISKLNNSIEWVEKTKDNEKVKKDKKKHKHKDKKHKHKSKKNKK